MKNFELKGFMKNQTPEYICNGKPMHNEILMNCLIV
jgi:hypothetical protein